VRTAEVVAACIQAEATTRAAWVSGWLTFAAGIAAVGLGYLGIRQQIASAARLQTQSLDRNIKQQVYLKTLSAGMAGGMTMTRLADFSTPLDEIMSDWRREGINLYEAHLVAPERVLRNLTDFTETIGNHIVELQAARLNLGAEPDPLETIKFILECVRRMKELNPLTIKFVLSMRDDLGMTIDHATYERIMSEWMEKSLSFLREFIAKQVPE
jgi:hypothetical protein